MPPQVIDLIDSTPPHPSPSQSQLLPPSTQPRHPVVRQVVGLASSPNFLSDEFDSSLFTFEEPGHSSKKRKITPQREQTLCTIKSTHNIIGSDGSLFTFSDDVEQPPLPDVSRNTAVTTVGITATSIVEASNPISKTKTYKWNGEESDPIVFTSSAPERTSAKERDQSRLEESKPTNNSRTKRVSSDVSIIEDAGWSDPFNVLPDDALDRLLDDPRPPLKSAYSERTAALLADLHDKDKSGPASKVKARNRNQDDNESHSDTTEGPPKVSRTKKRPVKNSDEKVAKTKDREATREDREQQKQRRDAEKEAEKKRKRLQKEEKAKEKQLAADIAEVNKSRTHKKESMPEMIVDMASSFNGTSVGNQVVEYVKNLGAEHSFRESPIPNIVRWRRKKKANYNEDAARWEPCQPYIASEDHVLCMLLAQEFVDMVICDPSSSDTNNNTQTLDSHVQRLKDTYSNCKPIYLIEGLSTWMRKNQNSRNRAYQAEVLRQINNTREAHPEDTNTAAQGKEQQRRKTKKPKKPEDTPLVADDTIEDALLQLQVTHNCLIYHTSSANETAEWIKNFSEHISTIPYRHVQMENYDGAAFCMETGQVKTGEDKLDTFVKMIQEVNRVTAPMAYGIANQYPSALDLLHAMKRRGPTTLENVFKSANKNGALTDSRIGPAVSKRLYKVFMGLDETATDV